MTTAERARWLLLTLALVIGLGGGLVIALIKIGEVDRQQDRDMCELVDATLPSDAPTPTTTYGKQQRSALERYREHRC